MKKELMAIEQLLFDTMHSMKDDGGCYPSIGYQTGYALALGDALDILKHELPEEVVEWLESL